MYFFKLCKYALFKKIDDCINIKSFLLLLISILLKLSIAHSQSRYIQQGVKISIKDSVQVYVQGYSVAISDDGNTAILCGEIGSEYNFYSFIKKNNRWIQEARICHSNNSKMDLSSDGNTAVFIDIDSINAAKVFIRVAGTWTQQGNNIVLPQNLNYNSREFSTAISGNGYTIAIGWHYSDINLDLQGETWVFNREGNGWQAQGVKIIGSGGSSQAMQGSSVSLSDDGNTLAIGGKNDIDQGATWIYSRTGSLWTQQGTKLVGTGNKGGSYQGITVSLSSDGNTLAVGGDQDGAANGATWVFSRSGNIWSQQGNKLVGSGSIGSSLQGYSLCISPDGNNIIVGGFADDNYHGAAWIFQRYNGNWVQVGDKLVGNESLNTAYQGYSCAISANGSTIIFGGILDNNYFGANWIFQKMPLLTLTTTPINTAPAGVIPINNFVKNTEVVPSPTAYLKYYLSTDPVYDPNDQLLGEQVAIPSIPGNGTFLLTAALQYPTTTGQYYVLAVLDANNLEYQYNPANLIGAIPLTVGMPDLRFASADGPLRQFTPGDSIAIGSTVVNVGNVPSGLTNVQYVLSTDDVLDANDLIIGASPIPFIPGVNNFVLPSQKYLVPKTVAAGQYRLIFVVDRSNLVAESDETNNIVSLSANVAVPDLTINYNTVTPLSGFPGDPVSLSCVVQSSGSINAKASVLQILLSTDTIPGTGDYNVSAPIAIDALGINGSSNLISVQYNIPTIIPPGNYYFLFVADGTNTVVESKENNNVKYIAFQITAYPNPDLTITAPSVIPAAPAPGAQIIVSCSVSNTGTAAASASAVQYYFSTDKILDATDQALSLPMSTVALPAGQATAAIELPFIIPASTPPGNYYILFVADVENVVSESNETNNLAFVAIAVTAPLLPDLSIANPAISPLSAAPGDVLNLSATVVVNRLAASVANNIFNYYWSTDAVFNPATDLAIGVNYGVGTTTTNAPVLNYTVPAGTAAGTYYIIFAADVLNNVAESNETNNSFSTPITVVPPTLPDLSVSLATASPSPVPAGSILTINSTVSITGATPAANSLLSYYWSTDNVFNATTDQMIGQPIAVGLVSGAVAPVNYTVPSTTAVGTYYIFFVADAGGTITESNETNNVSSVAVAVGAQLLPDLLINGVLSANNILPAGGSGNITSNLSNAGNAASLSTVISYYLSLDSKYDANDLLVGGPAAVGPIPAGGALTVGPSVIQVPAGQAAGEYVLLMYVNPQTSITESDYANNVSAIPFTVTRPDFVNHTPALSPSAVLPGGSVSLSVTVNNQGNGPAAASIFQYYLSANATFEAAADVALGTAVNIPGLAAGIGSNVLAANYVVPAATAPGAYYILFVCDPLNAIGESNEANNVASLPLTVNAFADLTVSVPVLNPDALLPGGTLAVSGTVKNTGGTAATEFFVQYYLSSDATYSAADDIALGQPLKVTGLAVSTESAIPPLNFTFPETFVPGKYYVIAVADGAGAIKETSETNNTAASALFTLNAFAELTVSAPVLSSYSMLPGETLGISGTVKNTGGTAASEFFVQYYLSSDAAFSSADDMALGQSLKVTGLATATETALSPIAYTFPETFTPGKYYVIAVTDEAGAVKETSELNNTSASALLTLNAFADLTVAVPVLTPADIVPGNSFKIDASVKNSGGTLAPEFLVQYYISTDNVFSAALDKAIGEPLKVSNLGIGLSAAVPTFTYAFSEAESPGTYYIFAVADEAGAIKESNEANNTSLAAVLTVHAFADLLVSAPVFTASHLLPGESISIVSTVTNSGGTDATAFFVKYYLSKDNILGGADDVVVGEAVKVSGLAFGTSTILPALPYTLPLDFVPGKYFVFAVVDEAGVVKESNESNNSSSAPLTVFAFADLSVSAPSFTAPHLLPGESISLSSTISNSGPTDAAGFAVQYYLSADAVLGGAVDILMGESVLVNSLAAGTSLDLSGSSYTLPLDFMPGKYFVIAVVDAGGMVRESNESNNTTSAPLTVFAFADLTVSAPSFTAPHLLPGEAISLSSTVKNTGATDATSFSVQYYLSSDAVLGGALDVAIGDPVLVPGLAAGVSLDLAPLRYQLPADFVPGKYFVIAQVDNSNLIYESNEDNNTSSAPLTVFAFADLTISSPAYTAPHLLPGETIKFSSVVSNRGETNATEFFVQYYLSSDSILGAGGKDILVGEPLKVSSLAATASLDLTQASYTLPLDFVPGKYFVIAVVDGAGAIKESIETNNASSSPLRVFAFADLSVSSLLVSPAVLLPGSSFGVSSLVTNSGETEALGTKLHYFLSTDALFDSADRPILDSVLLSSVAPGASFEVASASFLVPLDFAPGNYFVLASIDILKASYESNELNNTASTPLLVQAFPDLVPTLPLITPATALLPLDVVSINSSIVNSGGTPAASFGVRYYLSLNASLDAADILIAPEFTVPSLGHGLTATLTPLSFTLPDTLLPGTYYILASADQSLAVYESNEKNNVAASAFTVFAYADLMLVNAAATPLSLLPGESLSIAATLVNTGESDTRKSSSVQYFLSSDPLRDDSDIALGAPTVMAPLDGGALAAVPAAAFAVPMGTVPGSYYILVSVNEERAFPERDFTNNLASIPLLVSVLPDYSVPLSGVQVSPAAVFAGDSLSIGCTLANSGGQSAGTIVSLEYFLSSDSLYSADDLPLGPIQLPLSPDSGSSSEISSRKVLLPISTPAGSYYVILASDLAGAVLEGSESNNNAYFKIAVSALPDLTATVAASPLKLVTGETVLMSASVHNSGSDAAPFSVQYFFSSDLTLDIADSPISEPIAVEGGLALGAGYALPPFSYTIPQGTYAGTYYVLVSTDAKKVIRESSESNNLGFVKLSIVYPDLADLSVADAFVAPSLVVAGDSLSLECTLKNIGTAAPLASSTLRYLLSIDASPDSSDLVLASFPIAGLAPGDALAFNLSSFAVPPFVPSGKYFVLLVSDADHVLSEANEGNNTAVLSIEVAGRADLSFSTATASSKALFAGDTLFISSTVKNSGAGTTQRAVTMQYYLSSDSLFDIADLPLGNGMSIGKLSQGRALSFSGSFPLPLSLEGGDYFLLLYADNTALIKEASEENNMAVLPLKVRPFSELHVNGPLAIPARVYPGDNATFSAEVENTGPGKPDSAFQVMFFLSEDKLFDEGDVPVSGLLAAPALAPGQHKTFGVQYNFSPSTLPGTYYVLVVADGGKLARESDETNNIGMAVIQVGNPLLTDLVVNAFVLDPTLVAGDSITVEATVSDSGLAAAVSASRFQYFISKDRLFDNSDVALGASIVIPALAIGEKVSFPRRKWRVPLSTAPGEYFLLAFADVTNKLSEADEENNIHPVPLHILPFPDLKVLRASASVSSLYIGDSVTMKASVGNIFGSETKRPVGLQYLLSSDALADPSDIRLSSETSVPPLIVNDRIDTLPSLTLQVPDTIKGGYYFLLAFVDYKNQLIETNESNNFVAIPLTVKPRPVIIKPDSLLDSVSAKDVIRLNINVKSELPVASVSFTYRKVTDSLETVSRELPLGLSYSGAIPKTFLDEIGAEYFFLATDSSGNKSLLSKGSVAVEWPAPGLEIPYHSFGAAVKNYRVITIPLKLKVPAIDSVFYKPLGEYNKKKWRIYHYKDSSNREFLNGTSAMLAGDGYWFIAKDSTGNPITSGPGSTVDATIEEPFRVTLKKGWNQVGNPYNMDIYWQDILAFKKNNPAVLADFKQWKGDWTEGDTLARMEGGFVLAAKNTTLYFPTIKRKVVPPGAAPFRLGNAESPSEDNWKLSFLLESKGQRYSLAGLGMHPKAVLGKDDRDDLAPPRFLDYLEVVFDHPEYFYPRFTRDIVPAADAHVWDFDVASQDAGTKTLSWDAPLFSGKMLLLYDREAERAISMEKLSSYTFESGSSRHMRVYYGSPESIEAALAPSTITLSNPYPNPYSESASVSLSLPPLGEAYSLDLALYNALGQKVNTIAGGTFAHGFHEFSLSSISTAGERLPQGIYILRLEVNGKGASREIARKVMIK